MMRSARYSGGSLVFWPLVLLAIIIRLSVGSLPLPQFLLDDPLKQFTNLSTLCDSQDFGPHSPDHHHAADVGDGIAVVDDLLAILIIGCVAAVFLVLSVTGRSFFWCFPPVRGPPLWRLSGIYAQGPPNLI
ncbi:MULTISPECIES: hypothetical protein [Gluconobacter]|uniref:hypothetical protein n=1 Tax=Gluconobacter TaxID=441 RepID=UPI0002998A4A|nr:MULTISPECIES: hypothetical protein [Gluconobacter]AFW03308.1 hypothetical protein B932_3769 [Gluconobacter oxydans H24]MBS1104063.1 hypothetical protein [Gluconobacter sp. Dm-62]